MKLSFLHPQKCIHEKKNIYKIRSQHMGLEKTEIVQLLTCYKNKHLSFFRSLKHERTFCTEYTFFAFFLLGQNCMAHIYFVFISHFFRNNLAADAEKVFLHLFDGICKVATQKDALSYATI